MDVTLALLCDSANVSTAGTLNILGQFNTISATAFPVTHPMMRLVLRFKASQKELGAESDLTIRTVAVGGDTIGEINGRISARGVDSQGRTDESPPVILDIANMSFEQPGDYAFRVLVDRDEKATVPLYVVESAPEQEA